MHILKTELVLAILVVFVAVGSIAMADTVSDADSFEMDPDTAFERT